MCIAIGTYQFYSVFSYESPHPMINWIRSAPGDLIELMWNESKRLWIELNRIVMDWIDLTWMVIELNGTALIALISVSLNWIKLDWTNLDWIELDGIVLTWIAMRRIELKFIVILDLEIKWAGPNHIEVKWIELDWVELISIEMNCIGLNWIESNEIQLRSWNDLNGIEWTDHYSDDLPNLLGIQYRQVRTHIQVVWRPSQTYMKSDHFPLWNCSQTALAYIPLCGRPSQTLWKSDTFPLWICSWVVWAGTDPYSTFLATFTHLLEI